MKKLIAFISLAIGFASHLEAQELLDLYNYDYKSFNPSYVANSNNQSFSAFYNHINPDFNGPREMYLAYDHWISKINSGVGVIILNEQGGFLNVSEIHLMMNHKFTLSNQESIGIGLNVYHEITSISLQDIVFEGPDAAFIGLQSATKNNLDAGINYQTRTWTVGIGASSLLSGNDGNETIEPIDFAMNAFVAKEFKITDWFSTKPSILFVTREQRHRSDFNIQAIFLETIDLGYRYRLGQDYHVNSLFVGIDIQNEVQLLGMISISGSTYSAKTYELGLRIKIGDHPTESE